FARKDSRRRWRRSCGKELGDGLLKGSRAIASERKSFEWPQGGLISAQSKSVKGGRTHLTFNSVPGIPNTHSVCSKLHTS
ncbi:unnamed protein product, partial [Linum tenue]